MIKKQENYCLLVDDDPEDQELFIDVLQDVSPATICYAASNGEEALKTLFAAGFIPDIIVTDLNMPRMNGLEFLSRLRGNERFRNIPVIILTSDISADQIQSAKRLGVMAYYFKTGMGVLKDILRKHFTDPRARVVL